MYFKKTILFRDFKTIVTIFLNLFDISANNAEPAGAVRVGDDACTLVRRREVEATLVMR
jgi:hypothetical protein